MSISTILVEIFDNIIRLNGMDIIVLFDKSKNIWFSLSNILKALEYKTYRDEIKDIKLNDEYISTYSNIFKHKSIHNNNIKNVQPHMKMISEAGLYLLLNKSRKPYAQQLKTELYTKVLPSIRKTGEYKVDSSDKLKLKKLTKKLELIQKEQSMKRLTTKQYTKYINSSKKGFIYILKVKMLKKGIEKICYKIGYTSDLNKRLESYKTGHPDIELVHQENVNVNKKQLEKCVLNLNILKRLQNNNEIICDSSLEEIINEIKDCKKLISKYSKKKDNLKN
jgi:prophage antirepressor-like protein